MSNWKFPGFVKITPEHARSIQFDVPLYYVFLHSRMGIRIRKTCPPEHRREFPGLYDDFYWNDEYGSFEWYIKTDGDKPEYSPTTTTDTQHQ